MLDTTFLRSISDEELLRWYSVVNGLNKRYDVTNELQFRIKTDLEAELKARGLHPKQAPVVETSSIERMP